MVRTAILRMSMSSAIRRVAGLMRLRYGVMVGKALSKSDSHTGHRVMPRTSSMIGNPKSASPYNRNVRYKRTCDLPAAWNKQAGRGSLETDKDVAQVTNERSEEP